MEVQKDVVGQHQKPRECPVANKTCHKCGKNGHFARVCLGKSFKHRIQSLQAEQEIDMAEYENNPALRYQASQIKVCARVNQVKEPARARTASRQKDSNGHNSVCKNPQSEETKDCLRMRVDTCGRYQTSCHSAYTKTIFDDVKKEKNCYPWASR